MKICIDARWIFPEISGIGLYTQELIHALSRLDRQNEYVVLFGSASVMARTDVVAGLKGARNFELRVLDYGIFSLRNQLELPRLLEQCSADVYHSTNYMMPLRACGETKRIVTMHDLIPLMFRDHAPKAKKARLFPIFKRLMFEIGKRADHIIAVSESTKRDITRELRVPPEKISVTLEGVTPNHKPTDHRSPTTDHRLLYVGRRDPYKNLVVLIDAFSALRTPHSARLRIVGPPDERYPEAAELAKKLGLDNRIDWIGYAKPEQLLSEYQNADVFVLPSKYEGFGLTVLEAMACGAPVVCSNVSSLPEVVGDAGLLVPPNDPAALARALERVLTDQALSASLREKGIKRAAQFTWEQTARKTLKVYASLS